MPLFGNTLRVSSLTRRFGGLAEALGVQVETANLVARMNPAPTAARITLINNLIVSLKSAGIWTDLDVFYVLAAHDAQAARLNWKGAPYSLTEVNSPTFTTDRGYTGNGTSSYLSTGWRASDGVKFTLNEAGMWVWSRSNIAESIAACGVVASNGLTIFPRSATDNMAAALNDNVTTNRTNANGAGLFGASRTSAATKKYWRNGAQVGADVTAASVSLNGSQVRVCGASASSYSTREIAAFAAGASLTGKEADFYNALNTYMIAVGAA